MSKTKKKFEIKYYSWTNFLEWLRIKHPEIKAPVRGCTKELRALDEKHSGLIAELIEDIRNASDNRAQAIYLARRDGWWPRDTAVEDIRTAPGNRAWIIYRARQAGWWPKDTAVEEIRTAPGDRAFAIYLARRDGWWPRDTAVEDIRTAPGDRAFAIYGAQHDGWWPDRVSNTEGRKK